MAEGVKGNRYGHEEDPAWAAASDALHHDGAGLPETVSPAAADKERLTERTDRRMGGSGQRYDPPAKGDWLIKSRNSLPRTTRTTRTAVALGWGLVLVVASPQADADASTGTPRRTGWSAEAWALRASSIAQAALPTHLRLGLGAGLRWCPYLKGKGQNRPQSKPPDRGRAVGCGPSWLGQAAH